MLHFQYVDTGAMYRAVALVSKQRGVSWSDADAVANVASGLRFEFAWDTDFLHVIVDGVDVTAQIRADDIGRGASDVSVHPAVRSALLDLQRDLGHRGGVVMDGRDIGTVVLPDAGLKIFLDADLDERARRRHEELLRRGEMVHFDDIKDALEARDKQDRERPTAPLVAAVDAIHVDTSKLTIREAIDLVLELARSRGA